MRTKQQLIEFLGSRPRWVHFVGIGGIGMSGLARILAAQGHRVTGSDKARNDETDRLAKIGIKIYQGHAAKNVRPDVELVVHTAAVNGANEELQAALTRQIPAVRRGLLLSSLMTHRTNIAVAGTHGKTTTTAMIAAALLRSDSAPSFCVGAQVPVLGGNAQVGGGKYFVAEACESDGTLVGFSPEMSVCLNIEPEHLDFHGSMENLLGTFETLFRSTLRTVFYCSDCSNCVTLAGQASGAISFGLSPEADYHALDIVTTNRGSRFTVACRDQKIGEIELVIPGRQNVVNALAAVAVVDQLGVPFAKVAKALAEFTGAKRRFERHYDGDGIVVVDDYAHHPTEIKATIAAAKTLGFKRIVAAFQPHRYSRTQALRADFGTAFAGVEKLLVTDIYAASEEPIAGIDGLTIPAAVKSSGHADVAYEPDFKELTAQLVKAAQPGDLILTMGAGDICKVAKAVAKELSNRGPNVIVPARETKSLGADLSRLLSAQSKVLAEEPLAKHTSMRVGGPAQFWVEPWDEQDLARLLGFCHKQDVTVTVVGRGTNLLVRDSGIAGVTIHLGSDEFGRVDVNGRQMTAGSGARLKNIVMTARKHNLGGLEFMEGIPGSLGGALRMNAGAMGQQTFEVLESVRYVNFAGEIYGAPADTLPVSYRCCPVFASHIALSAVLRGQETTRESIDEKLARFSERRWATQPKQPSAGCVFKNPTQAPAGRLIDELGLKGTAVGAARVSELHGNFIVNEGGATATDVLRLIEMIRDRVQRERGIELETEVQIMGRE